MNDNIFRKDNLYFFAWILLVLILLIISQMALYSKGFYSISADESGHTLEAFQWYNGEAPLFSIWLPFQKILYGTALKIYFNLVWTPRILSSLFGILTILSLMLLTYELFQNQVVSILAGFLGSIFSCLIIFSVLPMSEIYFFFFIIISIYLLLNWKRTRKTTALFLTLFFSCIGNAIRYEAWIFSALIFIIIVIDVYHYGNISFDKYKVIIGSFILLFSFPIFWIMLSYVTTGSLTSFLHSVTERYTQRIINKGIEANILYHFLTINLYSLNVIGLLPLIYFCRKEPKLKIYALIFFITLLGISLITFITNAMPTHNLWRLASIWSIMLIPFTAQWLYLLLAEEKVYLKFNFVLFSVLLLYFFNVQTLELTKISYTSREDIQIGSYINNFLKFDDANSKIYIARRGWTYTSILVASQQPNRFITEEQFKHTINSDSLGVQMVSELKRKNIEYLILTSSVKPKFDTLHLDEEKKFNNWTIFKLR